MTDTTEQINTSPVSQVPQPMTNEQRIEAIKMFLFQNAMKKYQDFSAEINNLCIDLNIKRIIVEKLDDAWLWVKEAFNVLQVNLPEVPKAPTEQKEEEAKEKKEVVT